MQIVAKRPPDHKRTVRMRAVGYARVSTARQADDGVSLDAQRACFLGWCDANGYKLANVFTDAGLSGGRADNRPGLQDALQTVCKTRGAVLVVYSLSRLARSTRDALSIAETLDKAGADLVSLSERIDTTTAAGKMIFRMLAVLAEFERDQVSERTRMALAHKRTNGQRISGNLPFGYDLAPDRATLTENPDEQAILADIRAARASGRSLRWIADDLNRRNVPTKTGARWSHQVLAKMLKRMDTAA